MGVPVTVQLCRQMTKKRNCGGKKIDAAGNSSLSCIVTLNPVSVFSIVLFLDMSGQTYSCVVRSRKWFKSVGCLNDLRPRFKSDIQV